MPVISNIVLFLFFLLIAGFFSGVETGIYVLDPLRYHIKVRERNRFALSLHNLLKHRPSSITMMLIGTNLFIFLSTMSVTNIVCRYFPGKSVFWQAVFTTLITAPFVLVFAEIVPKNVYRRRADTLVYDSSRILKVANILFYPVTKLLSLITYVINTLLRVPPAGREGIISRRVIEHQILESAETGSITKSQQEMVQKILKLSEKPVAECMIPLDLVTMVSKDVTVEEVRSIALKKRFTRMPVFSENRKNIVGVVNIFDVPLGSHPNETVSSWIRPAPMISRSIGVDEALVILQTNKQPLGIVVGGEGEPIGIVTVKDLLEEITGEIYVW